MYWFCAGGYAIKIISDLRSFACRVCSFCVFCLLLSILGWFVVGVGRLDLVVLVQRPTKPSPF